MDGYWRGFLLDRRASKASPKTLQWHETSYKRLTEFIAETGQSSVPLDWDATFLREFIVWLQEQEGRSGQPLSKFTVRTWVNSIFAFCKWLYQEEVIETDITIKVKKPKLPDEQKEPFNNAEMKAMLKAAKGTKHPLRDTAIILTLFDVGIRASELCKLDVGDFLQDELRLIIRQGKGKKDRTVPVSAKTAMAITQYLYKVRKGTITKNDALFESQRGKNLTISGLELLVKRVARGADVTDVHPHRFRHTAAISLLRNGADVMTVKKILGHSDLAITENYLRMLHDDLSRVHASASPVANLK